MTQVSRLSPQDRPRKRTWLRRYPLELGCVLYMALEGPLTRFSDLYTAECECRLLWHLPSRTQRAILYCSREAGCCRESWPRFVPIEPRIPVVPVRQFWEMHPPCPSCERASRLRHGAAVATHPPNRGSRCLLPAAFLHGNCPRARSLSLVRDRRGPSSVLSIV